MLRHVSTPGVLRQASTPGVLRHLSTRSGGVSRHVSTPGVLRQVSTPDGGRVFVNTCVHKRRVEACVSQRRVQTQQKRRVQMRKTQQIWGGFGQ